VSTPDPTPTRPRWKRIALVGATVGALLLGLVGLGGYLYVRHLNSNITVDHSADGEIGRPIASGSPSTTAAAASTDLPPMNILVMGSDTRIGQNGEGGSASVYSSAQSDVVMLVHLSGDRKRALVMSIPRDTWVHIPSCKGKNKTWPEMDGKFNEAFTIGGPACTIKLFKQVTGIPVDHFVVIDFNGVKQVIDAVGGVKLCLNKAMQDPKSHLDLPAGPQTVGGEQGLAFLRVRHNIGDPTGDIGRLNRQHLFLGAMIKQVQAAATLTNPVRLVKLLEASTKAITTDAGLGDLFKLKSLAESVAGLPGQHGQVRADQGRHQQRHPVATRGGRDDHWRPTAQDGSEQHLGAGGQRDRQAQHRHQRRRSPTRSGVQRGLHDHVGSEVDDHRRAVLGFA